MKRICYALSFLLTSIVACNMPKPDQTVAMMNQYWNFYKVENYDSLKTFYSNSDKIDTSFWNGLHKQYKKYGNLVKATLINTTVEQSLGEGERISLGYEVEHGKKVVNHEFSFKKDEKGVFRIISHTFQTINQ